jgi:hypothetical protein
MIYGISDPEFVGVMPVRQDILVLPGDDFVPMHQYVVIGDNDEAELYVPSKKLKLGWTVSESIGVGVVNTRGVAAGRKSVTVGK